MAPWDQSGILVPDRVDGQAAMVFDRAVMHVDHTDRLEYRGGGLGCTIMPTTPCSWCIRTFPIRRRFDGNADEYEVGYAITVNQQCPSAMHCLLHHDALQRLLQIAILKLL